MDKEAIAPPMVKVAKDRANATKKRGLVQFMRAALFKLKCGSPRKSADKSTEDGLWRSLVGAVRPLHELPLCTPPPPQRALPADLFHDDPQPPPSPPFGYDEADGMSRYASAEDLRELERKEGCGGDGDADGGDDAINVKADEFITKFYEQMRLQRLDSISPSPAGVKTVGIRT